MRAERLRAALALGLALSLGSGSSASAHTLAFGVLEVRETAGGADLTLRAAGSEGRPPRLTLEGVGACRIVDLSEADEPGRLVRHARLECEGGFAGEVLRVGGLAESGLDIAVEVRRLSGAHERSLLDAASPRLRVDAPASTREVFLRYLGLGVEHILVGVDHLLFVLALLLVCADPRARSEGASPRRFGRLVVGTITGFTLGHSLTLGLGALGAIDLPSAPVEACIALSLVVLAAELLRRGGDAGLTFRRPLVVAALFGLVHGLGFAGALGELGLPAESRLAALFAFNLGVELGQLAVVFGLLVVGFGLVRLRAALRSPLTRAAAIGVGLAGAFLTAERIAFLFAA